VGGMRALLHFYCFLDLVWEGIGWISVGVLEIIIIYTTEYFRFILLFLKDEQGVAFVGLYYHYYS
jgi:hypothetical protein